MRCRVFVVTRHLLTLKFGGRLRPATQLDLFLYYLISVPMPAPTRTESTIREVQEEAQELADKDVDSVDSNVRYAAYTTRLRTALRSASR